MEELSEFTDSQLEVEIARRKKEAAEREAKERKDREVLIDCPCCEGKGSVPERDGYLIYGERVCWACKGRRQVKAYRAR